MQKQKTIASIFGVSLFAMSPLAACSGEGDAMSIQATVFYTDAMGKYLGVVTETDLSSFDEETGSKGLAVGGGKLVLEGGQDSLELSIFEGETRRARIACKENEAVSDSNVQATAAMSDGGKYQISVVAEGVECLVDPSP